MSFVAQIRVCAAKKQLAMRKVDERFTKEKSKIEYVQHKFKTLGDDEDVGGQEISANGVTIIWHVRSSDWQHS